MLVSVPAFAFSSGSYKNGDVNIDGTVNLEDVTTIQLAIAKLKSFSDTERKLADFDLDGDVDMSDVTKIQRALAKLEDAPAETDSEAINISDNETDTDTAADTAGDTAVDTSSDETDTNGHNIVQPDTDTNTADGTDTENASLYPSVSRSVDIYFTNNKNWSKVYYYLFNAETGKTNAAWPGVEAEKSVTNSYCEKIFCMNVNTGKFDRVVFNDGASNQTVNIYLSRASSGFYISDSTNAKFQLVGTYAYSGADRGKLKEIEMDYPMGYKKKVWIWTPADYDANSAEKYKTVYMTDGQNIFNFENVAYGGWGVTNAAESLISNVGRGLIIVGIESTGSMRDTELTPNIGALRDGVGVYGNFENGKGKEFSDFVVETVIPYVRSNYNSSSAREDNIIAGSSSGGLEAFYIGMEHHDKFCAVGALSPAFILFGDTAWDNYLKGFDLKSDDMPKMYIYNGKIGLEDDLYPFAVDMNSRLIKGGYDSNKLKLITEEKAEHNEAWWRIVFPEFLDWALCLPDN